MNIITINPKGFPTDFNGKHIQETANNLVYDSSLRVIIERIKNTKFKRVVIFVHGGLNDPHETIEHFTQLASVIEKDGVLPVFIIWNSALFSSYIESLCWIRRGFDYQNTPPKWLIFLTGIPLIIIEDMARGLARFLHTVLIAAGRDAQTDDRFFEKHPESFPLKNRYKESLKKIFVSEDVNNWTTFVQLLHIQKIGNMIICVGADHGFQKRLIRFFQYWSLFLPNLLCSPLLDAIGKRAWDTMLRRTRTMTSNNPDVHPQDYEPPVMRFFKELALINLGNKRLDIIGHSMGAIVINEVIKQNPSLKVDNIVYMGAACSVRNFCESVGQYLDKNPTTKFFNLCLHPRAEVSEHNEYSWYLIRGSLLAWIDNFFADILTYDDRTMGSFENCVSCYDIIGGKSRAVTLKSFAADGNNPYLIPEKHGDFTKIRFWYESLWL